MTTESSEMELDGERAYLEHRVANLQIIVCDLLAKNEGLRRELQRQTGFNFATTECAD